MAMCTIRLFQEQNPQSRGKRVNYLEIEKIVHSLEIKKKWEKGKLNQPMSDSREVFYLTEKIKY